MAKASPLLIDRHASAPSPAGTGLARASRTAFSSPVSAIALRLKAFSTTRTIGRWIGITRNFHLRGAVDQIAQADIDVDQVPLRPLVFRHTLAIAIDTAQQLIQVLERGYRARDFTRGPRCHDYLRAILEIGRHTPRVLAVDRVADDQRVAGPCLSPLSAGARQPKTRLRHQNRLFRAIKTNFQTTDVMNSPRFQPVWSEKHASQYFVLQFLRKYQALRTTVPITHQSCLKHQ